MSDPWTDAKVVAAVARAICRAARKDPDLETPLGPLWIGYRPDARAALRAAAEAMAESGWVKMPEAVTDTFYFEQQNAGGDEITATAYNDGINFSIDNPWAGSTETGFGYSCSVRMDDKAAREFGLWLIAVTEVDTTPPAGETGE